MSSAAAKGQREGAEQKERYSRRLRDDDDELAADFPTGSESGMNVPIDHVVEEHSFFGWGKKHGAEKRSRTRTSGGVEAAKGLNNSSRRVGCRK